MLMLYIYIYVGISHFSYFSNISIIYLIIRISYLNTVIIIRGVLVFILEYYVVVVVVVVVVVTTSTK
jgi:hypothetical protein